MSPLRKYERGVRALILAVATPPKASGEFIEAIAAFSDADMATHLRGVVPGASVADGVCMWADSDAVKIRPPAVTLSTIHQAKGLEWDHVAVLGMSQGLDVPPAACFPFPQSPDAWTLDFENHQDAEAARVFYVALTRARKDVSFFYIDSATCGPTLYLPWLDPALEEKTALSKSMW